MAIFSILSREPVVQVGDKTRIRGSQSFVSKDEAAVTLVEIEPESGSGFIDVTGSNSDDWYLDWVYSGTTRDVTVSLRITTDGAPVTSTTTINVVTEADDNLFSNDEGIFAHETEVRHVLPEGKSSFNYVHRKAKELILDWFDEMGYRKYGDERIVGTDFLDLEEVRRWSEMWTLALIYKDLSNSVDDKFDDKRRMYESKALDARNRAVFRLDLDGDNTISDGEFVRVSTIRLSRT